MFFAHDGTAIVSPDGDSAVGIAGRIVALRVEGAASLHLVDLGS